MTPSRIVSLASVGLLAAACGGSPCGLIVSGPVWSVEGASIRVPVTCSNGDPVPAELALRGLPDAARWDAGAGVVAWTPTLSDAGVYRLEASLPSGERAVGRVGVADAFDASGNRRPDPVRYTEEYGLPVVHLDFAQSLSADYYVPATLTYRGESYEVELKYRGAGSLWFPKKSLSIAFPGRRFSDPALGISDRKKILLVTTFDDQTHVRNRLAFELWKRLAEGRFAVRTASAVVYLNGAFYGLYMLSEKLGGQVLTSAGLNGAGNLYQGKTHAANFDALLPDGTPKATWHDGYEKDEGTPIEGEPGAFDDLDAFVAFVATSDDARFASELASWADVDEYRDWWVLVMLANSADTTGKNGMLYHDPLGGRWRASVWDWGASLGQDHFTLRTRSSTAYEYTAANRLFYRLLLPPFAEGTRARLGTAVRKSVPLADVLALYDRMIAENDAVSRRDEVRWGETQRSFFAAVGRTDWHSSEAEVAYLRTWLQERWAFLSKY